MILLTKNHSKLFFSINNKFYDFISIGHAAQKVALLAQKQNKKISFKKLFVQSSDTHYEANLAIFGKSQVKISRKTTPDTDTRLRNQIQKIDGAKNVLILKNGQEIKFKHLIYSGEDHEWKNIDCIKGLKEGLSSQYTDTFADIKTSNPQGLYGKINDDIYFNINSERNFGADNYFMIHLADSLKKQAQNGRLEFSKKTKIRILNKGEKLISFNQQLETMVKNILTQNGIEIINNVTVEEIQHRKRQFVLKRNGKTETIKYGGFYQYLPFKVPDLLKQSGIDPLNVDPNTLLNNKFPAIHVIGNIVPTAFSFYAINYMSHVIAKNIINMELKSENRALYEGDTALPFWTGADSLRYLAANYKTTKSLNNIGSNKNVGKILAVDRKTFGNKQVSMYLNGSSYGLPYYFTAPKVQQVGKDQKLKESQNSKILSI